MLKSFKASVAWAAVALTVSFHFSYSSSAIAGSSSPIDQTKLYDLPAIVVVADRTATPRSEIGSAVTVIDRDQIERSQQVSVAGVLRTAPGLDIVASGGSGTKTSVFMRGSNSHHTLVIIDGVEMNDPSDPNGAYDFAQLSSENIEQIEVLRGSQSVLYGSDAIGGVINIKTRNGQGPLAVSASVEGGSYSSARSSVGLSGATESVRYSLLATRFVSDGFSSNGASSLDDSDGFDGMELSGKARMRLVSSLHASASLRYHESETELDKGFASGENPGVFDDPDYFSEATKRHERLALDWSSSNEDISIEAYGSRAKTERYNLDLPDLVYGSSESESSYLGKRNQFGISSVVRATGYLRVVAGIESEREELDQTTFWGFGSSESLTDLNSTTDAGFVSFRLRASNGATATVGVRHDNHDTFGGQNSVRVTAVTPVAFVGMSGLRLRASAGTGFNAPSLWQLYAPFYGDTALIPEKSESWDVGADYNLSRNFSFSLTLFRATFENLFGADPDSYQTVNIGSALTEGVEFGAVAIVGQSRLAVDYTYTLAKDRTTGAALVRRPKNKLNVTLDSNLGKKSQGQLRMRHVGSRTEVGSVKLASYTVVDLALAKEISKNVRLNLRVENLLDTDYQEIANYNTPGLSLYGGVSLTN